MIKKILVAVDFSDASQRALEHAIALAAQVGGEIDVVHAWASPAYVSPSIAVMVAPDVAPATLEAIAREEAQKSMDAFLAKISRPEGLVLRSRLEFGREADVIVSLATAYDLLVVGTHGRSGLAHLVLGSTAERIVRHAKTPVLVIPTATK